MKKILNAMAAARVKAICVVDAMDESEDHEAPERQRRVVVSHFTDIASKFPSSRMKFLILSRWSSDIELELETSREECGNANIIVMERETKQIIKTIVNSYIQSSLKAIHRPNKRRKRTMQQEKMVEEENNAIEKIRAFVIDNAQGVILWVTLMMATLKARLQAGILNFEKLEAELTDLPTDLNQLYKRIVVDLQKQLPPQN
jgi:hypothetical protein